LAIFLICFLVVCGLVGLISVWGFKEQTYEEGLKASRQRAAGLAAGKEGKEKTGRKARAGKAAAAAAAKEQASSAKTTGKTSKDESAAEERSSSGAESPDLTKDEVPEVEPVVQEAQVGLHMTAAGKTKAAKQKKAAKAVATPAEDTVDDAQVEQPPVAAAVPSAAESRVPVTEPVIVKEEAVLLYDDKTAESVVQQSTPTAGGGKKKNKRAAAAAAAAAEPQDLMSAVKKTHFDEEELQNLIEILLNKQLNNGPSMNGSWVEPQPSEVKQLQKALQDRELQLEHVQEEQCRFKALAERYQRELGESKGQLGQLQRVHADFQNQINALEMAKREAEQNFRNFSHQSNYEIQNLGQQNEQLARQVNEFQMVLRSRQQTAEESQELKAELDNAKAAHSAEINSLHSQIGHRSNEVAQLKQQAQELRSQLDAAEAAKDAMSKELAKANCHSQDLESKVNAIQQDNTKVNSEKQAELQSKIDELVKSQSGLETSLNGVTCQLQSKESQVTSLTEANAQLAEKLAQADGKLKAAVEEAKAAKAAAQEAEAAASNGVNGHEAEEEARTLEFEAKLKQVHLEKGKLEEEIDQLKSGAQKEVDTLRADFEKVKSESETYRKEAASVSDLQSKVEAVKRELEVANSTLAQQRAKNDELRAKNWKVVDALKKAEDGLAKAKQSSATSALEVEKSAQSQLDTKYGEFLSRLFPDIQLSDGWQSGLETEVRTLKERLQSGVDAHKAADAEEEDKRQKLEKQVVHYKHSLQETESLLHKLQASVEAEEAKWKASLAQQQEELEALKQQNTKMESCVQSAEEMQEKLHQLQAKLVGHEEAKKDLEKSMAEKSDLESEEKERLLKEIESLKDGKSELGLQVARMNQLVTAGQEALQQEQKTVDLLREQLAKANDTSSKTEEIVVASPSVANKEDGLTATSTTCISSSSITKTNSASSKLGSVASLDLSDNQQQSPLNSSAIDKKKRKKKVETVS